MNHFFLILFILIFIQEILDFNFMFILQLQKN